MSFDLDRPRNFPFLGLKVGQWDGPVPDRLLSLR